MVFLKVPLIIFLALDSKVSGTEMLSFWIPLPSPEPHLVAQSIFCWVKEFYTLNFSPSLKRSIHQSPLFQQPLASQWHRHSPFWESYWLKQCCFWLKQCCFWLKQQVKKWRTTKEKKSNEYKIMRLILLPILETSNKTTQKNNFQNFQKIMASFREGFFGKTFPWIC